jgi:hypothetical protein
MQFWRDSQVQNILFSNLVLQDVTGPISINLNARPRRNAAANEPPPNGFVRNIMFRGIQARVLAARRQYPDIPFRPDHNPVINQKSLWVETRRAKRSARREHLLPPV